MGWTNRAKTWLTGRNGIYADPDKVSQINEQLETIKTDLEDVKGEISDAIAQLNACTGFTEYVSQGNLDTHSFDPVIDAGQDAVQVLVDQIQAKVDNITEYSEASLPKKAFATWAMMNAKIGEGVLSVAEDIGDGVVSVVGWVAPKDSGLEKGCAKFVNKEWSHDAFNFYYNSSLAKASAFTEDSGIAAGFKIAGSTAGYLALGGAIGGAAKAGGLAAKGGKVAKAANLLIGNTTRANTTIAAITGLGSGTESGLRQGKSMNAAFGKGVVQGTAQAAVAYGFGKYGEKLQKDAAIKNATAELDDAAKMSKVADKLDDVANKNYDDAMASAKKAEETFQNRQHYGDMLDKQGQQLAKDKEALLNLAKEDAKAAQLKGENFGSSAKYANYKEAGQNIQKKINQQQIDIKYNNQQIDKAAEVFENSLDDLQNAKAAKEWTNSIKNSRAEKWLDAERQLDKVKNSKLSDFEGYYDPITKAGQKFGSTSGKLAGAKNAASNAGLAAKDSLDAAIAAKVGASDAGIKAAKAASSREVFKDSLGAVGQKAGAAKAGISSTVGAVKELGVKGTAVKVGSMTVNAAKAAPGAALGAIKAAPGTVKNVGIAASKNPGTTGAVLNAAGREISNTKASQQFRKDFDSVFVEQENPTAPPSGTGEIDISDNTPPPDYNPDGYDPGGYNPGGYDGGGGGGSSSSGGGSSSSGGGTQKRKTTTPKKDNTNPTDPNKKSDDVLTPDKDKTKPDQEIVTPPSQVDTEPQDEVITPITPEQPSEITPDQSIPVDRQTLHTTGGSYSESDGYSSTGGSYTSDGGYTDNYTDNSEAPVQTPEVAPGTGDIDTPIDGIIKKGDYTKIPKSDDPITTTSKSGGSSVIPIAAGLSAAAAAGIGAKAYMDRKRNNDFDDDFESEEWDGDENIDMKYDSGIESQEYLDDNEDFGVEETQKYGARSSQELADLQ